MLNLACDEQLITTPLHPNWKMHHDQIQYQQIIGKLKSHVKQVSVSYVKVGVQADPDATRLHPEDAQKPSSIAANDW